VARRGNYRKYTSRNPAQRWLVERFLKEVDELVGQAIGFGVDEGIRVLDVGCGEGFVLERLCHRFPAVHFCGIDLDQAALSETRRRCPDVAVQVADAAALPFVAHSFDLVLCLEVLEHLEHPQGALDELYRVSRGQVLVSVPHQPFFSLANLLRGKNWNNAGDDPDHRQRWRPKAFLRFLGEGMEVVHTEYAFPWVLALGRPAR